MLAIEQCRTAALGCHVLRCDDYEQVEIACNSCRNRHCPKCQATAAQCWLETRQAELLPVAYYHVVFTLPAPISAIAYANKAVMYDLLFDIAAETLRTIAANPRHLGARIGATLVLHTWGSALTHHRAGIVQPQTTADIRQATTVAWTQPDFRVQLMPGHNEKQYGLKD